MRKSLIALLGAGLLFSSAVFALTLDQAKQQGRVGETLSGYIVALKQDKETLALVEQINTGRAEKYQEVANNNHISREDVAKWRDKSWWNVQHQVNMCVALTANGSESPSE